MKAAIFQGKGAIALGERPDPMIAPQARGTTLKLVASA